MGVSEGGGRGVEVGGDPGVSVGGLAHSSSSSQDCAGAMKITSMNKMTALASGAATNRLLDMILSFPGDV